MTMEELHAALVGPVDRLGALLRSKEVIEHLNRAHDALAKLPALDDATAKLAVMEERLKKAGEREAGLRQQLAEAQGVYGTLMREHTSLQQQVATMRDHPDVRRAERERLAAQLAEIQRRHDALADPEPAKPDEPEEVPVDPDATPALTE